MERILRAPGTWMVAVATAALISGSTVSCGQESIDPLSTAPATGAGPVSTGSPTVRGPQSDSSASASASATGAGPVGPLSSGSPTAIGSTNPKPLVSKTDAMKQRVPADVVNKTVEAAHAQLSAAGIPYTVSFRETEDAGVGVVLEVDPVGGTVISEGQSVVLLVGKRKETVRPSVPMDLVNRTVEAAQAQLSAAGIPYTISFRETEDAGVGLVLEVNPVGGTVISEGQSVVLLVGKAKEGPSPTPPRADAHPKSP
jgi:PASTA domain